MPRYRRRNRKNPQRFNRKPGRRFNRSRRANSTLALKPMATIGTGFPLKLMMKHKYSGTNIITSTAGAVSNQIIILNGLYDVDYTLTGHQPLYFDTMNSIYNHWCVIGAKVTFTIFPYQANTVPVRASLYVDDDTTPVSTLDTRSEQATGRARMGNHDKPMTLTLRWSAKKNFGGAVLSKSQLCGDASNNPTEIQTAILSLQSVDQTATTVSAVQYEVELLTVYFELKDITSS